MTPREHLDARCSFEKAAILLLPVLKRSFICLSRLFGRFYCCCCCFLTQCAAGCPATPSRSQSHGEKEHPGTTSIGFFGTVPRCSSGSSVWNTTVSSCPRLSKAVTTRSFLVASGGRQRRWAATSVRRAAAYTMQRRRSPVAPVPALPRYFGVAAGF